MSGKGKQVQQQPTAQKSTKPQRPRRPKQTKPATNKDAKQDKRIARLEARVSGPEVKETWSTTVNLGIVNGVETSDFTRAAHVFLHPALLRDVGYTDATTPTAIRAAQYAMYRVHRVRLAMHSLVGSAGVAGTLGMAALQLDSSVGAPLSFDAAAARQHVTCGIGRNCTFQPKLPSGEASWQYTDTKAHTGAEALGPTLEVFLLGATQNIYTNQAYTSGLWRLTAEVTYQFSNYSPNLQLADLAGGQEQHTLEVKTEENGDVVISTAKALLGDAFHTAQPGITDVIFSLVDVAGGLASQIPILGPILDTGLAFLKPILGGKRAGHEYLLCGSFDEAKAADAITVSAPIAGTATGDFRIQQLTPANLGSGSAPAPGPSPGNRCSLPQVALSMDPVSAAQFAITIPCWTTTVSLVGSANSRMSLTFTHPITGSSGTTQGNGKTTKAGEWPLRGYANQKVFKWVLCANGTTNGANAVLTHVAGQTSLGSSGLLGTAAAIAENPAVIPDYKHVDGQYGGGWCTVQSSTGVPVAPGSKVLAVHFNNWYNAQAGQKIATLGWLILEPWSKTIYVLGAYEIPSGVNSPGDGVAHFYTVMDSRGFTGGDTRNSESLALWSCWEEL